MGTNDAWMTQSSKAESDPLADDNFSTGEPLAPAPKRRRTASASANSAALKEPKEPKEPKAPRPPRAAPRSDFRIAEQPSFVLHSYPYRETSLVLDVFSRDHGRVALVAKGAKRPHSALRGVLQTFQPLGLSWTGKGEVRTLTQAEWVGGMLPLAGDALLCGFYVNELLVKFCAREDAHPVLFNHYVLTLSRLAHGEPALHALRSFERVLLRETGYAMAFNKTITRQPVSRSSTRSNERSACKAGSPCARR